MKLKYLILSTAFMGCALLSFGQPMKVESAYSYITEYNNYKNLADLDEAKKLIDIAKDHEKTSNEARTWYYRGLTYQLLFQDTVRSDAEKPRNLLATAIQSYLKAAAIDAEGDKKRDLGNDKKEQLARNLITAARQVYGQGVREYQGKDYEAALNSFEAAASVYRLPAMKSSTDTNAFNNAAVSAASSGKLDVAIKYYDELLAMKYKPGEMYYLKAKAYKDLGDEEKYAATIKEGRAKYPDASILVTEELNMALKAGKNDEALKNLELAIKNDPNNKILQYNLGSIYYNLANYDNMTDRSPYEEGYQAIVDKSEAGFKKAMELDPAYFDAYYNLGALYINHAKLVESFGNKITDDKKYEIESKKADEYFDKSLPLLEKALELSPDDYNTMSTLKQLYLRKGQMDKFKAMDEKLNKK